MKLSFLLKNITMFIPTTMIPRLNNDLSLDDRHHIEDLMPESLAVLGWTLEDNNGQLVATSEL